MVDLQASIEPGAAFLVGAAFGFDSLRSEDFGYWRAWVPKFWWRFVLFVFIQGVVGLLGLLALRLGQVERGVGEGVLGAVLRGAAAGMIGQSVIRFHWDAKLEVVERLTSGFTKLSQAIVKLLDRVAFDAIKLKLDPYEASALAKLYWDTFEHYVELSAEFSVEQKSEWEDKAVQTIKRLDAGPNVRARASLQAQCCHVISVARRSSI